MSKIWNEAFDQVVEPGKAGTQAQRGIFFDDFRGIIRRLTEAEGHEISYNPETVDRNPIGQEEPESEVRTYRDTFGKDIIIRKGAPNYEFFNSFLEQRPTGDNAKLKAYIVDFMKEEAGGEHNKYLAYSYMITCTVESGNYTDGTLTVNFSQAGGRILGVMGRTDTASSHEITYGFTPSSEISITGINLSDKADTGDVTVGVGKERRILVEFAPLGSEQGFIFESSDPDVCEVNRNLQSLVITGKTNGTASITITSVKNSCINAAISVKVGEGNGNI